MRYCDSRSERAMAPARMSELHYLAPVAVHAADQRFGHHMVGRRHLAAAEFAKRLAIRSFLPEAGLREFDHLTVIGRHEACGAEEIGLAQPSACHVFRVLLKAKVGP